MICSFGCYLIFRSDRQALHWHILSLRQRSIRRDDSRPPPRDVCAPLNVTYELGHGGDDDDEKKIGVLIWIVLSCGCQAGGRACRRRRGWTGL